MKRICAFAIILTALFGLTGCNLRVPVKEKLINYDDNSTVYLPIVETGNVGVDASVNERLKIAIADNFKKVKGDKNGTTTEGFTAFQSGDLLSIFHEGFFEEEGKPGSGESYLMTFHINVKNGNFYSLDDLFIKGYEDELTKRVCDVLDLNLGEFHMTFRPNIKATAFDVFDNEIIFIFNPETVAPAHYGFIDAPISFSQISDLLNKESEFYHVITAPKKPLS